MMLGKEEAQSLIAIVDKIIDKQDITEQHVDIAHGILSILGAKEQEFDYAVSSWPSSEILSQVNPVDFTSLDSAKTEIKLSSAQSATGNQLAAVSDEVITKIPFTKRITLK